MPDWDPSVTTDGWPLRPGPTTDSIPQAGKKTGKAPTRNSDRQRERVIVTSLRRERRSFGDWTDAEAAFPPPTAGEGFAPLMTAVIRDRPPPREDGPSAGGAPA